MPVHIKYIDGKYSVSNLANQGSRLQSQAQIKRKATLRRALDHGWQPDTAVDEAAQRVTARLLQDRDDIGSLPIPASGKAYARMQGGIGALKKKEGLYMRMARDLGDPGMPLKGFKNRDGSKMGRTSENVDDQDVKHPLERSFVEPTHMNGAWPKGIAGQGKTSGKFKFPRNFKVGHAIKEAESPKDFLKRQGRRIEIKPDPSHDGYYQVPIPKVEYGTRGYVNLFKPETESPGPELKKRLAKLVLSRKGYAPGDTFFSPWGNFQVTDTLSIKEV